FPDVPASEGRYLAFLGRTSPEKGLEEAIEIARRSDLPLRIAAKIDPVDEQYFDETIAPLLAEHDIEFVGEIGEDGKAEFLCGASALLFPINWPEPFGLVMIEAAACGTPVLAFRSGSVPEVIEDGVSGVIVEDVEAAVRALPKVVELPREGVRDAVRRRFNVERMAADYVQLYRRLIAERKTGESGDDRRRQPTAPVGPGVADWEAASESKPLERTSTIGVEHASNRPTD
ncbi:MAG TPA: glycosyltransferase, partial [Candidatus Limnocylindria bacterium]|nr:glycosyltransferase [Candidatus Limnocylindria bacterium]